MARTDVENTIERIRRQLDSNLRLEVNTVAATMTTTTDPITFTYDLANSVRPGAVLSVGRELMRVVSINAAAKTANVIRGWQDSDAEAHAIGDEILINPRFTRLDIYDGIIQEIDSWQPDIFTHTDIGVTFASDAQGFEIPSANSNALGVIELRRNYTEEESLAWPEMPYTLQRGLTSSLTPTEGTGLYVRFTTGIGRAPAAGSLAVRLAVPYDSSLITSEASDLVSDVGLDAPLLELVELGVKARLMMNAEYGRSGRGQQDEPRRAEETPPNTALTMAQATLQSYERRRHQEVDRMRRIYPYRAW